MNYPERHVVWVAVFWSFVIVCLFQLPGSWGALGVGVLFAIGLWAYETPPKLPPR
jgi:hypothetical protein